MKSIASLLLPLAAAASLAAAPQTATLKEVFFTTDQSRENIDSPAVWHGPDGQSLLFATSKAGHSVNVFDAANGAMIRRLGGFGAELGQFNRPNGVWAIDNYLLVVERDNHRVQVLHLPSLVAIASFGEEELVKPYGLYVQPIEPGLYHVYVTDSYETPDEQMPADADLSHRVHRYELEAIGATADADHDAAFGATEGPGRLFVVESIHGDPVHNRLLVAEELEDDAHGRQVKVYDLDGNFAGQTFGQGIFQFQVEGIALYQTSPTAGYWIITDQGKIQNFFHVFDRESFAHLGTFSGERTLNTDGVWLSQTPMPRFPRGAFYACDNDKAISAFDLAEILQSLNLTP